MLHEFCSQLCEQVSEEKAKARQDQVTRLKSLVGKYQDHDYDLDLPDFQARATVTAWPSPTSPHRVLAQQAWRRDGQALVTICHLRIVCLWDGYIYLSLCISRRLPNVNFHKNNGII